MTGKIQTGSYTNREGRKIYTTDVVAEDIEFAESKAASERNEYQAAGQDAPPDYDGFMNVPEDEEMPFS